MAPLELRATWAALVMVGSLSVAGCRCWYDPPPVYVPPDASVGRYKPFCARDPLTHACSCATTKEALDGTWETVEACETPEIGESWLCCYALNDAGTTDSCRCARSLCTEVNGECECTYRFGPTNDPIVDRCTGTTCLSKPYSCRCIADGGFEADAGGVKMTTCAPPVQLDCMGEKQQSSCGALPWNQDGGA